MQEDPTKFARKVLPRWRSLARTPTGELVPGTRHSARPASANSPTIETLLNRWKISNNPKDAAEVLDAAFVSGNYAIALPAALQLVENPNAMPSLRSAAGQILGHTSDRPRPPLPQASELETDKVRLAIRSLKLRLELSPRDSITNLEIARLQTLLGQTAAAKKYVERGLSLAPNNRYVLRSTVRFWVHYGDKERALHTLWRTDALRFDPWLQAAEVAVADICNRPPKSVKRFKGEMFERRSNDLSYSELASGLAMLELKAGAPARQVRKLLRISLQSPTENALAQAIWSRKRVRLEFNFDPHLTKVANANEARAWAAYQAGKYEAAVNECGQWLQDEFFSTRAAIAGASICVAFLGRYSDALTFAEHGLRANPDDRALLNSKLVALAYGGRITEALGVFPSLLKFENDRTFLPFIHAARGLLAFKVGNFAEGRRYYELAVEAGRSISSVFLALNAAIYWLEQEVSAGTISPKDAVETVRSLDEAISKSPSGRDEARIWTVRKKIIDAQIVQLEKRADILHKLGFPNDMLQKLSA
jgi:tetratricopeptide (TPR) repeat protein